MVSRWFWKFSTQRNCVFTNLHHWQCSRPLILQNPSGYNVVLGLTNPTSKLTVSGDVLVSGAVTATSFNGDGSGLTGVVGSGSGVVVQDDGSNVGTVVQLTSVQTSVSQQFLLV